MDILAYISSGVLESYVLGELSAAEAQQVEEMAARYPEVREELRQIEEMLEVVAQSAAVAPRPSLRNELLDKISPELAPPAPARKEAAVKPLPASAPSPADGQRWLMAASIGLAVVSSLAAVYFWSRWQRTEEQLASMLSQNTLLVQHVATLEDQHTEVQQTLAVFTNPSFKTVPLQGLAPAPEAQAVVYWSPEKAEVFLNPGSLPTPPTDKQYQLWAIVDGQPVDAGVFEMNNGQVLLHMKDIQGATAFAITLEPQGGSAVPTTELMYVYGSAS